MVVRPSRRLGKPNEKWQAPPGAASGGAASGGAASGGAASGGAARAEKYDARNPEHRLLRAGVGAKSRKTLLGAAAASKGAAPEGQPRKGQRREAKKVYFDDEKAPQGAASQGEASKGAVSKGTAPTGAASKGEASKRAGAQLDPGTPPAPKRARVSKNPPRSTAPPRMCGNCETRPDDRHRCEDCPDPCGVCGSADHKYNYCAVKPQEARDRCSKYGAVYDHRYVPYRKAQQARPNVRTAGHEKAIASGKEDVAGLGVKPWDPTYTATSTPQRAEAFRTEFKASRVAEMSLLDLVVVKSDETEAHTVQQFVDNEFLPGPPEKCSNCGDAVPDNIVTTQAGQSFTRRLGYRCPRPCRVRHALDPGGLLCGALNRQSAAQVAVELFGFAYEEKVQVIASQAGLTDGCVTARLNRWRQHVLYPCQIAHRAEATFTGEMEIDAGKVKHEPLYADKAAVKRMQTEVDERGEKEGPAALQRLLASAKVVTSRAKARELGLARAGTRHFGAMVLKKRGSVQQQVAYPIPPVEVRASYPSGKPGPPPTEPLDMCVEVLRRHCLDGTVLHCDGGSEGQSQYGRAAKKLRAEGLQIRSIHVSHTRKQWTRFSRVVVEEGAFPDVATKNARTGETRLRTTGGDQTCEGAFGHMKHRGLEKVSTKDYKVDPDLYIQCQMFFRRGSGRCRMRHLGDAFADARMLGSDAAAPAEDEQVPALRDDGSESSTDSDEESE